MGDFLAGNLGPGRRFRGARVGVLEDYRERKGKEVGKEGKGKVKGA